MSDILEITWEEIPEDTEKQKVIEKVVKACFEKENLMEKKLTISIILTVPQIIQNINKEYRNIDNPTDVLSFPMFEKEEVEKRIQEEGPFIQEVLGDIIISIPKVEEQAKEYGHGVERELAYMVVHGFYHLMGYDHMEEEDKRQMRAKEEEILGNLKIER